MRFCLQASHEQLDEYKRINIRNAPFELQFPTQNVLIPFVILVSLIVDEEALLERLKKIDDLYWSTL